jgi:hypothetical protein
VGYFEKPANFDELKVCLAAVLNTKRKEYRAEVRVRLRVNLKLKGMDADGTTFEVVTRTESVSANGFHCLSTFQLKIDSVVAVFTVNDRETYAGKACMAWVERGNTAWSVSGFRFVEKPHLRVLQ